MFMFVGHRKNGLSDRVELNGKTSRLRTRSVSDLKTRPKPRINKIPFRELKNAALVRELHVYGQLIPVSLDRNPSLESHSGDQQHVGFGTRLMREAENIALTHSGVERIAVISGVGVRHFYRKLGYKLRGKGEMMIKELRINFFKKMLNARFLVDKEFWKLNTMSLIGFAIVVVIAGFVFPA